MIRFQIHSTDFTSNKTEENVVSVSENDYKPSIEYFRCLIERNFNIPRENQLSLSIAGVSLDQIETMDVCLMSERIWRSPNPITLHHYACTDIRLSILSDFIDRIEIVTQTMHISRLLYLLSRLWYYLNYQKSKGTYLYFVKRGFLQRLKEIFVHINSELAALPDEISYRTLTDYIDCISQVVQFLWHFGFSWEILVLISKLGFCEEILKLYSFANNSGFIQSFERESDELIHVCHGAFQMIIEVKGEAIKLGNNVSFLNLLKHQFLETDNSPFEFCLKSLVFLSISIYKLASVNLYSNGIYEEILEFYVSKDIDTMDYRVCRVYYNVCMITLNSLRTPDLVFPDSSFLNQATQLLEKFLQDVQIHQIVSYEEDHSSTWNILEYFVCFFFIPKNSLLGFKLEQNSHRIVNKYIGMAHFTLEVLLRQERHRERILANKLVELLIIADWLHGSIQVKLRKYFPDLTFFPVPTLHDISAVNAFCYGLGDYSDLMNS